MRLMKNPKRYKNGGKVMSDMSGGQKRESGHSWGKYQGQAQNEKGINRPVSGVTGFPGGKGTSDAGDYTKDRYAGKPTFSTKDEGGHPAVKEHHKVLNEMKAQPNPKLKGLAHGGEVESEDAYDHIADDDNIHEALGQELMGAIHAKDHKKIMSGIEAMVLSCLNKKEDKDV